MNVINFESSTGPEQIPYDTCDPDLKNILAPELGMAHKYPNAWKTYYSISHLSHIYPV